MQTDPRDLYDFVKLLLQCGAGMARISLRFVRGIWLTTAAALLGGIYYLNGHIDAHWLWSVPYFHAQEPTHRPRPAAPHRIGETTQHRLHPAR